MMHSAAAQKESWWLPSVQVPQLLPLFQFETGLAESIRLAFAVIVAAAGFEQTEAGRQLGKAGDRPVS